MARRCPQCNSKLIRHDRSLGGRAVCGACGRVLTTQASRTAAHRPASKGKLGRDWKNSKTLFAWLLPTSLIGSYLFMWANPRALTTWTAPYSASTRNSWQIRTPADIELLIGKAQQDSEKPSTPPDERVIREIANKLTTKGVHILISDSVTPNAGGEWDPSRGELRIRPSTVSMGTSTLAQALAHESAHVAQSCRAGGLGRNSEPMGIQVDPARTYQQQLSSSLYKGPPSTKAIELEAYSVGAIPEWAPKLLDHYCR